MASAPLTIQLQSGKTVSADEFVKAASDALADGKLTFGEIVSLGGLLAAKANQLQSLSGQEKQELVIAAIQKACELKAASLPEAEKAKVEAAAAFAKETLPSVLTLAVDAARGKLDLKKAKKTCLTVLLLALKCAKVPAPVAEVVASAASEVLKTESAPETVPQPEKPAEEAPRDEPVQTSPAEPVPEQSQKVVAEEPPKAAEDTPAAV